MRSKRGRNILLKSMIFILIMSIVNISCISKADASIVTDSYLKYLRLSEGGDINFTNDKHTYITEVKDSIDEISVKAKPTFTNDKVYINGVLAVKEDKYKVQVDLLDGKNKIVVDVIDCYDDSKITYTVYVYKGGMNAVFFKDIRIDYNEIGYDPKVNLYNIERDKNDDNILLDLLTLDESYKVEVNGEEFNPNKSIKVKFGGLGKYVVNIKIIDKETGMENKYILNIYVGIPLTPDVEGYVNSILKPNQWVIVNGRWRYNDSEGKPLKNQWFYDNGNKAYYYLDQRGNMQTGWYEYDENVYYYLGTDGKRETGWVEYNNEWYYINYSGVMDTGWIFDNGKWYYLSNDGTMATGWTKIDGVWYYFAMNGEMRTGWILYDKKWYDLNDDGSMNTGWYYYKDEWYFLNGDGSMIAGDWINYKSHWYYINYSGTMRTGWLYKDDKYYYFNEDGTMNKSSKVIDGYLYSFNNDGSVNFG
ncbi:MAG: cadherin-like beta sandwich domain-containing protein [Clostridium sp.]|nr:cadherin-like beta sandwich domain-containing protein [Clostridium sp.]